MYSNSGVRAKSRAITLTRPKLVRKRDALSYPRRIGRTAGVGFNSVSHVLALSTLLGCLSNDCCAFDQSRIAIGISILIQLLVSM